MLEKQRFLHAYLRLAAAGKRPGGVSKRKPAPSNVRKSPHTLLVSCYETAVSAQHVLRADPYEILHHTEIAALVPPYDSHRLMEPYATLAKFEYAIEIAGVRHFAIMGHTGSEGMQYLLDGKPGAALYGWAEVARMSRERALQKHGGKDSPELSAEILRQSVLQSARNVLSYPCVYNAVKTGRLSVNALYYDDIRGDLYAYDADKQSFETVMPKQYPPAGSAAREKEVC
jgi:carbonic anhydrase